MVEVLRRNREPDMMLDEERLRGRSSRLIRAATSRLRSRMVLARRRLVGSRYRFGAL